MGSSAVNADLDVAIIGMAALYPGAPDLTSYWQNILDKVDAITDPPPGSWDPSTHFDPTSTENDRVYCQKGGYLAPVASFNPLEHGVMPVAVEGGEPDQWLALKVARAALADAGYLDRLDVRHRTSVVIGKGTYINRGNLSMVQHSLMVDQTLRILKGLRPDLGPTDLAEIRAGLKQRLPPFDAEAASGLIPNIVAGRIANRLDLMGPSYTVDAACASSLIAAELGLRDLQTGECDLALVGGAQISTPIPIFTLFCQLNALSHRQQIRPFDRDADGTILGEGIGMIVLKRRRDAERDGDRIYAILKSVGTASDGRGASVMAPRVEGEELAVRRAYEKAGVDPRSIALVEAHGTATTVGDSAEVQALTRVFGQRDGLVPTCAIGTVKSMIGHTMPAAGVAGLIKAALALYHRVLPPTLNVAEPNRQLTSPESRFYVSTETRPWIHNRSDSPRRAGVNAFGFGGINAHAVLEEYADARESTHPSHLERWDSEVLLLQAADREGLIEEIDRLVAQVDRAPEATLRDVAYTVNVAARGERGASRLGVVASDLADLRAKLSRARQRLLEPRRRAIRDVTGLYYSPEPLADRGKLAVLFPGEGSQYQGMLADLCNHFPVVRAAFDQMDRIFRDHPRGYRPSDVFFPPTLLPPELREILEQRLWRSDSAWEAVLTANHGLWSLATLLGITPDVIVGHSTGEYSAMRAAGVLDWSDESDYRRFVLALNRGYQDAVAAGGVPPAAMLAVGADRERVQSLADRVEGRIYLAMDNCLHQAVLVGDRDAVERARQLAQTDGLIYEYLAFDRAYHTPDFAPYLDHLVAAFSEARIHQPRLPIYSCTTSAAYPDDPDTIRQLMVDHWVRPVEFRRTIETLYDQGVRIFLETGARGNLTTFVEDILRGRPHAAIAMNVQRRSGTFQLNHALAQLGAHGYNVDFEPLYLRRRSRSLDSLVRGAGTVSRGIGVAMQLPTGFPELALSSELLARLAPTVDGNAVLTPPLDSTSNGHGYHAVGWPPPGDSAEALDRGVVTESDVAVDSEWPIVEGDELDSVDDIGWEEEETANELARAAGVQEYLRTMDRFLAVQGDVLHAFMGQVSTQTVGDVEDELGEDGVAGEAVEQQTPEPASTLASDAPTSGAAPVALGTHSSPGTLPSRGPALAKDDPSDRNDILTAAIGRRYPLLGAVISLVPSEELVTERHFDPADDLYLRDHTLGRQISDADPDLLALPVMPLTMSLEILAEAAAALAPHRTAVGLRDLRAYRWIAFDDEPQLLRITARRIANEDAAVAVDIRNLTEESRNAEPAKSPVIEATILLADAYPERPDAVGFHPAESRPSRWQPDRLYRDAMFHGPTWQGVTSIGQTGSDGTNAKLAVLPRSGFFHNAPAPSFVFDPVVLDAAGQVVGFWTLEHLSTARMVFPFRLASLEVYGPPRPIGEPLTCSAQINLVGVQQVRSDIDIVDDDGNVWMRLRGWEDLRFELPPPFHAMILSPRAADVSVVWTRPVALVPPHYRVHCRRSASVINAHHAFWRKVWAQAILNREERAHFRDMRTAESRQLVWLAGRSAAKDAVRHLLREHYGLEVPPADVEIRQVGLGRLRVHGAWRDRIPDDVVVSISYAGYQAAALAGLVPKPARGRSASATVAEAPPDGGRHGSSLPFFGLGFHVEPIARQPDALPSSILSDGERLLLAGEPAVDDREWLTRGGCAKEAVGTALGYDLTDGPRGIEIVEVNRASGIIRVVLAGHLARAYPELSAMRLVAYTSRDDNIVAATTLCELES